MQEMGQWIQRRIPKGWFFVLLLGAPGASGRTNYIANVQRGDVVRLMYEFIEATKGTFGEHVEETPAAQGDTELGRLRQKVSQLEGELSKYRQVLEPGSGKGAL